MQELIHAPRYYPEYISKHKRRNEQLHLRCYPSDTVILSAPNPLTSLNAHMHTLPFCLRDLCEQEGEWDSKCVSVSPWASCSSLASLSFSVSLLSLASLSPLGTCSSLASLRSLLFLTFLSSFASLSSLESLSFLASLSSLAFQPWDCQLQQSLCLHSPEVY